MTLGLRIQIERLRVAIFGLALLQMGNSAANAQEDPVIESFSRNGELTGVNFQSGDVAVVEWSSTLNGP